MKTLWEFLATFWKNIRPWIIVNPWEQAIRVRFGKRSRLLPPGIHQTLQTVDGKTVVAGGCIAYEITDITALYSTLHHPEDALIRDGMIAVAREIRERGSENCNARSIEQAALARLNFAPYGVNLLELYLTDFAFARTYRLINAPRYGTHGDNLNTSAPA